MASANGDRNLLFGVLALQMDFITRDALVRAMHAWVLDKAKGLGQILVEQGALSMARCAMLEPLVQEHVKQHGDDPGKSLAAVSSVGSVRQELQQIADPDVQASLIHLPAAADPYATKPPSVGAPSAVGRRFRVLRPHARGGLGEVFVAHDEELHREVALKEIQERHADQPESRARFLVEAEITGGLEHPGIVPVYGLGTYDDGRPFYAMRFIRGDSLKEAIEHFHKPEAKRRPAGERALELRKLLGRFVDVSEAIAYAHSRGVLHRDLKPGNVMLGKYGETLVVDWGLAKPLGRLEQTPDADEPALHPASASGSAETLPGRAIGTPGYMSPEQAAGRLEQIGPASDVYGLGAILYTLLTAKPPFSDPDVGAVLRKVQQGEFPRPRQINRDVSPALEAICLKAMALKPEERYATPRALVSDIEHWLGDEPVSAYREPLRTRLARWGRRHKTLVTSAAVLLITTVVALAAGLVLLGKKQEEIVSERNAARKARDQALKVTKFYQDYVLAAPRPKGFEGGASTQVTLREALDRAVPKIDEAFAGEPELEAAVRHTLGVTYFYLGRYEAACAQAEKAYHIRRELLGPDHADTILTGYELAEDYYRAGKLDQSVALYRETLERGPRVLGPENESILYAPLRLGSVLENRGDMAEAESLLRQGIDACKHTLGPDHHHSFCGQARLADLLADKGQPEQALALKRQTFEGRRRVLGDDAYDTLLSMGELGALLRQQGELTEAEPILRQNLAARTRVLGAEHNDTLYAMAQVAFLLEAQGKLTEAEELHRQALAVWQRVYSPESDDALYCQDNIASNLDQQGKRDEAEKLYRETLETRRRVLGPDNPHTLTSQDNLAWELQQLGKRDEAEKLYRQTLETRQRVLGPENSDTLENQNTLANMLGYQGKFDEAEKLHRQTLEARRRILGPENSHTLTSQDNLAWLLQQQGKRDEAEKLYRQTLEIRQRVFGPDNPNTLASLDNLASMLSDEDKFDEAENLYREKLAIQRKALPAGDVALGPTLALLGEVLTTKHAAKEAEPFLRECLEIRQKGLPKGDWRISNAESLLGGCLSAQGKYAEAEPLLLGSYDILKTAQGAPAPRVTEALNRIVKLYEAWDKPEQAAAWRAKQDQAAKAPNK